MARRGALVAAGRRGRDVRFQGGRPVGGLGVGEGGDSPTPSEGIDHVATPAAVVVVPSDVVRVESSVKLVASVTGTDTLVCAVAEVFVTVTW